MVTDEYLQQIRFCNNFQVSGLRLHHDAAVCGNVIMAVITSSNDWACDAGRNSQTRKEFQTVFHTSYFLRSKCCMQRLEKKETTIRVG